MKKEELDKLVHLQKRYEDLKNRMNSANNHGIKIYVELGRYDKEYLNSLDRDTIVNIESIVKEAYDTKLLELKNELDSYIISKVL